MSSDHSQEMRVERSDLVGPQGYRGVWRRLMVALGAATTMTVALAGSAWGAAVDPQHFVIEEQFPPTVITDLPCLEGEEFLATGSGIFRGTVVDAGEEGFHFSQIEKFEATLVPVDGEGPTYVESGSAQAISLNVRTASGVFTFTNVNNDSFIAYEDGKVVSAETIRIHELYHFVGMDTDGDGELDLFRVELSKPRFSCP